MTQLFPVSGTADDPLRLHKLKQLRLPVLAGKRFLDLACEQGFFCGYAAYAGARRATGLDSSASDIELARKRFPHCEFIQGGWDKLPEDQFDVILLATTLAPHEDLSALVRRLVSQLAVDGVLVLEVGVASSQKSEWVRITRGTEQRHFPSMPMLREALQGHAWKWMGPSVVREGDPVKRQVFHVSRARPIAYLLMQPPAHGKTSIAKGLFGLPGIPVVSGDELVARMAVGKYDVSAGLSAVLAEGYSPFHLDAAIRRAFDGGYALELLQACIASAGPVRRDFAIDMYVPQERHAVIEKILKDEGYLPVRLHWDRPGAALPSQEDVNRDADAYFLSMVAPEAPSPASDAPAPWRPDGCGFLDEVSYADDRLVLRGWAVDKSGDAPRQISVSIDNRTVLVENFERQIRQDVQRSLGLPHALLGYRIVLELPGLSFRTIVRSLRLQIPSGATFEVGGPLEKMLAGER